MQNPDTVLGIIESNAKENDYQFDRLYRNLYNEAFYQKAYDTLILCRDTYREKVEMFDLSKVHQMIEEMKLERYKPLRVSSLEDKMVQVILRSLLSKVYEPLFRRSSHGFRPMKNCHTALLQMKKEFHSVKWWIQKEVFFSDISHSILLKVLRKRIQDERFIRLVAKFLKAGITLEKPEYETYGGEPPVGMLLPILLNIYLSELDQIIEKMDGVQYVRYGGVFLVGVNGSKKDAEELEQRINTYLKEEREVDVKKEEVLHHTKKICFLGYDVIMSHSGIKLSVPYSKLKDFLIKNGYGKMTSDGKWKSVHRSYLLNREPIDIVRRCNIEFRSFYHYYKYASDVRSKLKKIHWLWVQSVAKTLAGKFKTKLSKLTKMETQINGKKVKKFYQNGKWGVVYLNKQGEIDFYSFVRKEEIQFVKEPIDRNPKINRIPYRYTKL